MCEPVTLILDHALGGSVCDFESYHHNFKRLCENDVGLKGLETPCKKQGVISHFRPTGDQTFFQIKN